MSYANGSAETMSIASSSICLTPTHTSITQDIQNLDDPLSFGSVPTQNSWFIIRIRNEGKYLSVIDGKVCLHETPHPWGGFRWRCVKKDGWFGFREFVTGRYVGYGNGDVVVKALKQTGKEYFAISHQPEGGYHLSVFHEDAKDVKELWQLKADKDGKLLLELKGHAALWEFCKVDSP